MTLAMHKVHQQVRSEEPFDIDAAVFDDQPPDPEEQLVIDLASDYFECWRKTQGKGVAMEEYISKLPSAQAVEKFKRAVNTYCALAIVEDTKE